MPRPDAHRFFRAFAVVSVAMTTLSCVFIVKDDAVGTTCHFPGEDTACGACIAKSCTAPLNSCCGNRECSTALDTLATCAKGAESGSCASLTSGAAPDLGECIESACPGCLAYESGAGRTRCESKVGDSCDCYIGDADSTKSYSSPPPPNDFVCDEARVDPGLCCADRAWPQAGANCECRPFTCQYRSATEIYCSWTYGTVGDRSATGPQCCAYDTSCTCSTSKCYETPVPMCSVDYIDCPSERVRVPSCSF